MTTSTTWRLDTLDTLDILDTLAVTLLIRTLPRGVRFEVRVQPRASRNEVTGEREGALRVRLTAPPVEGAANDALIELLAKALHVAKRDVRIISGVTARTKVVEIDGVTAEHVLSMTPR
ncbi:MAG TPA: DUF167 domain-containing protein [Gemmatimonadaceae bacterium]|nr:DUF167 domain-containing protein [Gemmatimonadaceae bacterium]